MTGFRKTVLSSCNVRSTVPAPDQLPPLPLRLQQRLNAPLASARKENEANTTKTEHQVPQHCRSFHGDIPLDLRALYRKLGADGYLDNLEQLLDYTFESEVAGGTFWGCSG